MKPGSSATFAYIPPVRHNTVKAGPAMDIAIEYEGDIVDNITPAAAAFCSIKTPIPKVVRKY